MRPKIFLSSTFNDLVDLRTSVAASLEYWGYEPIFFESDNFPKKPNLRGDDMCLEAVKQCPLFLLAIDKNYGSPYKGEDRSLYGISVTEAEAKVAFECHKEVFPGQLVGIKTKYPKEFLRKGTTVCTVMKHE